MDEDTKASSAPEASPGEAEAPSPAVSHEAAIWGSERPEESSHATEDGAEPLLASQWWPSAPPPIQPLELPPPSRGRWVAIVLAVLLVAGGGAAGIVLATSGSKQGIPLPSTSPSATPTGPVALPPPDDFFGEAKSGGEVALSWQPGSGEPAVTGYDLYRDDELLERLNAEETTYRDVGVAPEEPYRYAIEAEYAAGRSEQSTLVVTTPKAPPLSAARVTGGFDISGSFTHENFTNRFEGEKYSSFWSFEPTCGGDQACGVKTSGEGEGNPKLLRLRKGTYSGTVSIPDGGQCGSTKLSETQTITFTVTKAAFFDGVWQATKISGTSRLDVPAALDCQSGFGVVSFKGTQAS
jgi:hypothetical protein